MGEWGAEGMRIVGARLEAVRLGVLFEHVCVEKKLLWFQPVDRQRFSAGHF